MLLEALNSISTNTGPSTEEMSSRVNTPIHGDTPFTPPQWIQDTQPTYTDMDESYLVNNPNNNPFKQAIADVGDPEKKQDLMFKANKAYSYIMETAKEYKNIYSSLIDKYGSYGNIPLNEKATLKKLRIKLKTLPQDLFDLNTDNGQYAYKMFSTIYNNAFTGSDVNINKDYVLPYIDPKTGQLREIRHKNQKVMTDPEVLEATYLQGGVQGPGEIANHDDLYLARMNAYNKTDADKSDGILSKYLSYSKDYIQGSVANIGEHFSDLSNVVGTYLSLALAKVGEGIEAVTGYKGSADYWNKVAQEYYKQWSDPEIREFNKKLYTDFYMGKSAKKMAHYTDVHNAYTEMLANGVNQGTLANYTDAVLANLDLKSMVGNMSNSMGETTEIMLPGGLLAATFQRVNHDLDTAIKRDPSILKDPVKLYGTAQLSTFLNYGTLAMDKAFGEAAIIERAGKDLISSGSHMMNVIKGKSPLVAKGLTPALFAGKKVGGEVFNLSKAFMGEAIQEPLDQLQQDYITNGEIGPLSKYLNASAIGGTSGVATHSTMNPTSLSGALLHSPGMLMGAGAALTVGIPTTAALVGTQTYFKNKNIKELHKYMKEYDGSDNKILPLINKVLGIDKNVELEQSKALEVLYRQITYATLKKDNVNILDTHPVHKLTDIIDYYSNITEMFNQIVQMGGELSEEEKEVYKYAVKQNAKAHKALNEYLKRDDINEAILTETNTEAKYNYIKSLFSSSGLIANKEEREKRANYLDPLNLLDDTEFFSSADGVNDINSLLNTLADTINKLKENDDFGIIATLLNSKNYADFKKTIETVNNEILETGNSTNQKSSLKDYNTGFINQADALSQENIDEDTKQGVISQVISTSKNLINFIGSRYMNKANQDNINDPDVFDTILKENEAFIDTAKNSLKALFKARQHATDEKTKSDINKQISQMLALIATLPVKDDNGQSVYYEPFVNEQGELDFRKASPRQIDSINLDPDTIDNTEDSDGLSNLYQKISDKRLQADLIIQMYNKALAMTQSQDPNEVRAGKALAFALARYIGSKNNGVMPVSPLTWFDTFTYTAANGKKYTVKDVYVDSHNHIVYPKGIHVYYGKTAYKKKHKKKKSKDKSKKQNTSNNTSTKKTTNNKINYIRETLNAYGLSWFKLPNLAYSLFSPSISKSKSVYILNTKKESDKSITYTAFSFYKNAKGYLNVSKSKPKQINSKDILNLANNIDEESQIKLLNVYNYMFKKFFSYVYEKFDNEITSTPFFIINDKPFIKLKDYEDEEGNRHIALLDYTLDNKGNATGVRKLTLTIDKDSNIEDIMERMNTTGSLTTNDENDVKALLNSTTIEKPLNKEYITKAQESIDKGNISPELISWSQADNQQENVRDRKELLSFFGTNIIKALKDPTTKQNPVMDDTPPPSSGSNSGSKKTTNKGENTPTKNPVMDDNVKTPDTKSNQDENIEEEPEDDTTPLENNPLFGDKPKPKEKTTNETKQTNNDNISLDEFNLLDDISGEIESKIGINEAKEIQDKVGVGIGFIDSIDPENEYNTQPLKEDIYERAGNQEAIKTNTKELVKVYRGIKKIISEELTSNIKSSDGKLNTRKLTIEMDPKVFSQLPEVIRATIKDVNDFATDNIISEILKINRVRFNPKNPEIQEQLKSDIITLRDNAEEYQKYLDIAHSKLNSLKEKEGCK